MTLGWFVSRATRHETGYIIHSNVQLPAEVSLLLLSIETQERLSYHSIKLSLHLHREIALPTAWTAPGWLS